MFKVSRLIVAEGEELKDPGVGGLLHLVDVNLEKVPGLVADAYPEDPGLTSGGGAGRDGDLGELDLQLHEAVCVPVEDLLLDVLGYVEGVHGDGGDEVQEDVVAVRLLGLGVGE